MDKKKDPSLFDQIKGLTPVDPKVLAELEREMLEEVIPEIIRDVDRRRMLAAEGRHRQLQVPMDTKPEESD
jgi:hypothetical protein